MNEKKENLLDQGYQVALYQSLKYGWAHVSTFYGEDDTNYHGEYVRISEPMEIRFKGLSSEEALRNAIAGLDAEEKNIRLELGKRIAEIQERRSSLLALTHQPEPQS